MQGDRSKIRGIGAAVAVGILFLTLATGDFVGIFATLAFGYLLYITARFALSSRYSVQMEGELLVQKNRNGDIVRRIDLRQLYESECVFSGYLEGIYMVRQEGCKIEFTTRNKNAEQVVRDVLKLKWPPTGRPFGF